MVISSTILLNSDFICLDAEFTKSTGLESLAKGILRSILNPIFNLSKYWSFKINNNQTPIISRISPIRETKSSILSLLSIISSFTWCIGQIKANVPRVCVGRIINKKLKFKWIQRKKLKST